MKYLRVKLGEYHTLYSVQAKLNDFGYENDTELKPGQYCISGGNLRVFPTDSSGPFLIEFFGNTIDRICLLEKNGKIIERPNQLIIFPNLLLLDDGSMIKPEDYVVHSDHGIGIFSHVESKTVEGKNEQYAVIKYLKEDKLYVPLGLKEKISKYIGIGRRKPKLSRLGSKVWENTYKKTYENVLLLAKELLDVYAKRELIKRNPMKIDPLWDIEVKKTFGYQETTDQVKALSDTYSDLKKIVPMDRLICGDVGFGKTEVALRTSVQTVANGYQVAFLVPTTVLAEQHYVTFLERCRSLPISIARISRLIRPEEQEKLEQDINNGNVDIVIGTHKLFSSNLKFKNLGLLVIDEEQKFGVKQKELLKKIKNDVNVLALTATPIPRTLFMSLSGIRDMSSINTSPSGRKEIKTSVGRTDSQEVFPYIDRELKRQGQVYYLHNKVATIGAAKDNLQRMFPKARIAVAHGQMDEIRLANTMREFAVGKYDILVCSTIIENGLDLSNVNTLIVEEADKFGLSQLYQIRGRIGRSDRQSYALFLVSNKKINHNAQKRLQTLLENTEIGTGYNISLSDLEIRGGGNILGKEQHGNMEAVGLILYSKMLSLAVERLRKNRVSLK